MPILTESCTGVQTLRLKFRAYIVMSAALGSLFLGSLINIIPAYGDSVLGTTNIKLTGTVVALGCTVEPGDVDKPVQLGTWATKQLKKTGQTTFPVSFNIHLMGCSASGVTTTFTGTKDTVNPELLALKSDHGDYATGVGVQIMDGSGQRIPMGTTAPRGLVDGDGNVTLNFRANYVAIGDNGVKPGIADADTEFTLTYD